MKFVLLLLGAQAHKLVHRNTYGVGGGERSANAERDSLAGYPPVFVDDAYPGHDHKDVNEFVNEHINQNTGAWITPHEAELNHQAKLDKELDEAAAKPHWLPPADMMMDWDGHCYAIHAKTYGKECSQYGNMNENSNWKEVGIKVPDDAHDK